MKLSLAPRRDRSGYAIVVVLTIIVLLSALAMINVETAARLHRSVKRLDDRQQFRWRTTTNTVPAVVNSLQP